MLAVITENAASLLRVARKHSLCADDAHDAYQRALEIYLRRAHRIEERTAGEWLRTVVKHEAMAIAGARGNHVALEAIDFDDHLAVDARDGDELALSFDRVARSAEALRECKDDEVLALFLRAEGSSYSEIGDLTGWSYTNTSGNVALSSPVTIRVDNAAPAPPAPQNSGAWSNAAQATWTWVVPAQPAGQSPLQTMDAERCRQGTCTTQSLPVPSGGAFTYRAGVDQGETALRVRFVDSAGNVGPWSEPSVARADRTPPTVSIVTPDGPVAAGTQLDPLPRAYDDLSGVQSLVREYSVNGGPWQPAPGPVTAPAASTVRFRAIATDEAGNSATAESGDVVVGAARAVGEPAPAGSTLTPAPTQATTTPARRTPSMRIRSARLRRGRLIVRGTITRAATGRLRITFSAAGRRYTRRVTPRRGRIGATLRIPRARTRGRLTISYPGDARYLPRNIARTVGRK